MNARMSKTLRTGALGAIWLLPFLWGGIAASAEPTWSFPFYYLGDNKNKVVGHALYQGDRLMGLVSHYDIRDHNFKGNIGTLDKIFGNAFGSNQARLVRYAYMAHLDRLGDNLPVDIEAIQEMQRNELQSLLGNLQQVIINNNGIQQVAHAFNIPWYIDTLVDAIESENLPQLLASRLGIPVLSDILGDAATRRTETAGSWELRYRDLSSEPKFDYGDYSSASPRTVFVVADSTAKPDSSESFTWSLSPKLNPQVFADAQAASSTRLSVRAYDRELEIGTSIPVVSLFPLQGWADADGAFDITAFAIQDRTVGGGYLEVSGVRAPEATVFELPISDLPNWRFVAADRTTTDEIGFNIIQADGSFSPRLSPGARVTTIAKPASDSPTETHQFPDIIDIDASEDGDEYFESELAHFVIERRGDLVGDVVLSWKVYGIGSHPTSALDFAKDHGQVTVRDGDERKRVSIAFNDDSLYEPDEGFRIDFDIISGNAVFSNDDASATIINDDEVLPWNTSSDDHSNMRSMATFVEVESWAQGFIESPGDVDWFQFDLRGGGSYRISVMGDDDTSVIDDVRTYNAPGLEEAKAYLYSSTGTLIAELKPPRNLIPRFANESYVLDLLGQSDQTVYLSVREVDDADVGQYFVAASYAIRPDDYPSDVSTQGEVGMDSPLLARHERDGDDDWFRVHLEQGRTYRFIAIHEDRMELKGASVLSGSNGRYYFGWDDPKLAIYDSSGEELASTNPDRWPSSSNLLTFKASYSGTHYFSVNAHDRGDMGRYFALFQHIPDPPAASALILQPGPLDAVDVTFTNRSSPGGAAIDDEFLFAQGDSVSVLRFDLSEMPSTAAYAAIEVFLSDAAPSSGGTSDLVVDIPLVQWRPGRVFGDLEGLLFYTAISSPTVGEWVSIEITSLYNQWQSGKLENNGIVLGDGETSSKRQTFLSSAYAHNPLLRPRLIVYGADVEATVSGAFHATMSEDEGTVSGSISIAGFGAQIPNFAGSQATGALGRVVVDDEGKEWTYTLTEAAQKLSAGEKVRDSIFLASDNGHIREITVDVLGQDDPPAIVGATQWALGPRFDRLNGSLRLIDVDGDDPNPTMPFTKSETRFGELQSYTDGTWTYLADRTHRSSNVTVVDVHRINASDGTPIDFAFSLSPVNASPVANGDIYRVRENVPLSVGASEGVLANDFDVDGDGLVANLASDVDHGVLTLNLDGSFEYRPTPGWNGMDSFSYAASDGQVAVVATVFLAVYPGEGSAEFCELCLPGRGGWRATIGPNGFPTLRQ